MRGLGRLGDDGRDDGRAGETIGKWVLYARKMGIEHGIYR